MGFLLTGSDNQNLTIKPKTTNCINDDMTFTSKDLLDFKQAIENFSKNTNQNMNIKDMVNYFNNHFECNKIIDILKSIVNIGLEIKPKLAYLPTTEKCIVKNGKFKLSFQPLKMNEYYFLNNLVVVKYEDNTFDFFTNITVDLDTKVCDLNNPNINGECYVSYNYLTDLTE